MLFVEFDIDVAKEVWFEEGIEKGIEKGKLEAAVGFLEMGDSVEKIAKALKVPVEQIQKLKDDMKKK